jgi:hypothetical protein
VTAPTLAAVASFEEDGICEDRRTLFCWVELWDGRGALWQLDMAKPPGRGQTFAIIEGAGRE